MWADNEDPLPAVTRLLRAEENRTSSSSSPQFYGRSSAFRQCRRRCAVISATRMPTTCLVFALCSLHLRLSSRGVMKGLREGKVWGYLFVVSRSPVRLHAWTHLLLTDSEEDYRQKEQLTRNLKETWILFLVFEVGFWQRCWRDLMCATLKDMA